MSVAEGGGVFVSYRRGDSGDVAGRLADHLADRFGAEWVFIDVETIQPGADYVEAIAGAVAACRVLVAVIGPGWLSAADARGRRLDDRADWVRVEIGTALARGVRVVPVLVGGAAMPDRDDLPVDLTGLVRRNALRIRHESFRDDARRLIAAIEQVLATTRVAGGVGSARPAGDTSGEVPGQHTGGKRDDLVRAARLLDEAERIANSITHAFLKRVALGDVIKVVAATDPDRAERIANSVIDETSKVWLLIDVATAVVAIDPGRAAWLLGDAERIATSIPGENSAATMRGVAVAVAAIDPDRAERIASSIPGHEKAFALSGVAQAVAATDPGRAEHIAISLSDERYKAGALSGVAQAVAATDSRRAERIANSITDEREKAPALSRVAQAVAVHDPGRAGVLFGDAERAANAIPDEFHKALALSGVAQAVAVHDPGRAGLLFGDAERAANAITTDPGRAISALGGSERRKASALSRVARAVAATDPRRAEHIANSITHEATKGAALGEVARAVAATDPDRAERIANSITDEREKVSALASIAGRLSQPDNTIRARRSPQ